MCEDVIKLTRFDVIERSLEAFNDSTLVQNTHQIWVTFISSGRIIPCCSETELLAI